MPRKETKPIELDASRLASDLRNVVRGEVRFDSGSRAMYSTDASNYRQVPIGVVIPKDVHDVVQAVEVARRHQAPILARGGGTSLAGQCCNVAVVLDTSKYMRGIIELDADKQFARVEPGLVLDDLRNAAEKFHLTFAPDPATHTHCTLGGMIGNNSCGVHSLMGGRTSENIEELEILTYDGLRMRVGSTREAELETIIQSGGRRGRIFAELKALQQKYADLIRSRFPDIPRRVSGYGLDQLLPENGFHVARSLVGTEGTCVLVLEARVKLVHSPPARSLVVLGFDDIFIAGDYVPQILEYRPIGLEGIDGYLTEDMKKKGLHSADLKLLPDGEGWLLVEFGGETKQEADCKAQALMTALRRKSKSPPAMELYDDARKEELVWKIRESALGATARVPGEKETWEGWEDSAVPPQHVGNYLRDFRKLLDRFQYHGALYGHFGQGCIHTRIDFDLLTAAGIRKFRSFVEHAADLVVSYGGSFSGEHGDGQSRAELLPRMFGPELVQAFREFKAIWDPEGKMNPGKVVDPYKLDENLRLGADYAHRDPQTHFAYPDDKNSFSFAITRCVGVGECRKEAHGTMCPSYMVTREEMHSTRGRARLLFEMLEGAPLTNGWRDEHVKEALDLCFACKACKSECPVNVDMASYKSEFLARYYEGRFRPLAAHTMGRIYWWARIAQHMPRLVNALTKSAGLSYLARKLAGIAPQRRIPLFAPQTFRARFAGRKPSQQPAARGKVILWPDTFNNHFHPAVCEAALEVLERIGFAVSIPRRPLCCGRPLYDFGLLKPAKRLLQRILDELRDDIRAGLPIVVLEPSCAAVFRDELTSFFPNDIDAARLRSQTFVLSEFLDKFAPDYQFPTLERQAIVHGHCHHKAIMSMEDERKILKKLGLDFELLDAGCCGMAGAFGFEKEHYEISILAGERVLLPRVRQAHPETLIVADGFSCREQIAQTTNRQAIHLAEVIRMAIR